MTVDEAFELLDDGRWIEREEAISAAVVLGWEVRRLRAENAELRRRVTLGGPPAPMSPTWENVALPGGPVASNEGIGR